MKTNFLVLVSCSTLLLYLISGCSKKTETDAMLYDLSKETTDFVWYKNSDEILESSSGSGHTEPKFRTRYNTLAATQLNAEGKVVDNAVFPEGSLIVKDLFNNKDNFCTYAIMYKDSDNEDADADGWVWATYKENGGVKKSVTKMGDGCNGCHSPGIDFTLMNTYFP